MSMKLCKAGSRWPDCDFTPPCLTVIRMTLKAAVNRIGEIKYNTCDALLEGMPTGCSLLYCIAELETASSWLPDSGFRVACGKTQGQR